MPKYTLLSRVYLGDEELFELLSPKNVPKRELLRMARRRGLIFSEKAAESDVRSILALLPSSWNLVTGVLDAIARPDREERKTSIHITNCDVKNNIAEIVAKTKDSRAEKYSEIYNPVPIDDKSYKVEVTYTDVDFSKSVVYQRQEKKLVIEIKQDGDKVSFVHTANERAMRIVNDLKGKLAFVPDLTPEVLRISLEGIRDAALRTRFFTDLIKGIDGYKYVNATHVNVDRRFPADDTETEDAEPEEEDVGGSKLKARAREKIKGLINRVALTGDQVLADELYQTVEKSGYYISNIFWTCSNQKDPRFNIDCAAGFKDPVAANEFTFDVVRSWQFKPEAPDEGENLHPTEAERRELNRLLEAAAFKVFGSISKKASEAVNSKATKS